MLGACQPHLQTREKAERAATGRTGKPQGQEAADLGDHSLPLEVEVPLGWAYRPAACSPCPSGAFVRIPLPLLSGGWSF